MRIRTLSYRLMVPTHAEISLERGEGPEAVALSALIRINLGTRVIATTIDVRVPTSIMRNHEGREGPAVVVETVMTHAILIRDAQVIITTPSVRVPTSGPRNRTQREGPEAIAMMMTRRHIVRRAHLVTSATRVPTHIEIPLERGEGPEAVVVRPRVHAIITEPIRIESALDHGKGLLIRVIVVPVPEDGRSRTTAPALEMHIESCVQVPESADMIPGIGTHIGEAAQRTMALHLGHLLELLQL
jgi:hypothetical protein